MIARHSKKSVVVLWSVLLVGSIACNAAALLGSQAAPPTAQPVVLPPTQQVEPPAPPAPTVEPPTVAPPPTAEPTFTPTVAPSPTTGVITMGAPEVSTKTLYKGPGACDPKEITFRITLTNPDQVKNVILFLRSQDKSTDSKTDWDEGTAMNPGADGKYSRTFHAADIPTYGSFANAWLYYQFVVTDKQNKIIRGRVFTDVSFMSCP